MSQPLLKPVGSNIWIADGATVVVVGFRYPTRMAIIKLPGGGLFAWSPIALSESLRAEVDALGTVRFIAAPNSLHDLYLSQWQSAYPDAKIFAAPGLRERRKDLSFDADLGDVPDPGWAGHIDQVPMRGNLITTEVVFFHRDSGTALFTDLIQSFPPGWFKGWRAIVARLDRLQAHEPQVPQKFRVAFVDRTAARSALARILAWPIERVLMAHGNPLSENGAAFVARAFRWLSP